jgi:hypothetical protein
LDKRPAAVRRRRPGEGVRLALRTALRELRVRPGEVLTATYASESRDLCDAENILIYNLDSPGVFAAIARRGLRFERSFDQPPP